MELPTLSKKEQVVSDRRKESLELDSTKSDLDLMKEELQKIIDKMSEWSFTDLIGDLLKTQSPRIHFE